MAVPRILLAEQDAAYLEALEWKFAEELRDHMELIIITEPGDLELFFSQPQQLSVLIINENLYNFAVEKHNISSIFLLSEEELSPGVTQDLYRMKLYKYTSVNEIFRQVMKSANLELDLAKETSHGLKTISVYSPIGGIGKTTVAMGICQALAKKGKRVLFIGTDSLQTFGYFMRDKITLSSDIEKQIAAKSSFLYSELRPVIARQDFDILPPLSKTRPALRIGADHYVSLLGHMKEAEAYEYIVLDLATEFTELTITLFSQSDNIVLLMGQDKYSACKASGLLDSIDCSDERRFTCVCNQYDRQKENHLLRQTAGRCHVRTQIDYDPGIPQMPVEELGGLQGIEALSLALL